MAFIAAGFTFSDNVQDQGSASNFASFAASCTITGIALTEFRTSAHVVQPSATTPVSDQGAGSLWFDTTLNILRVLNSTRWDCPYEGAEMLNPAAGANIPLGAWVVASADNSMSMCATASWPEVLGFLTATTFTGVKGIVRRTGVGPVRALGPIRFGDVLIASLAFGGAGYCRAATMVVGNTSFTGGIEIGMALGTIAGATTGLVTAMAWR